ncbi:aldehyde oxidase GLOX-like [Andrographis paniculata]|uniref:aldehyde oxidase GLOX-like n=1 Tax=Andrographis paniculata TaxID=175694 RepID=UPI0021E8C084|nr:aldehyde oxidase GLOX-like [Andrographis paniculata]
MAAINAAFLTLALILLLHQNPAGAGEWNLLNPNAGVPAMHMQLLNTDRVVILDRTDFGASNISLPNNRCRDDPRDLTLKHDCTAHSVEYDVVSNTVRPLNVLTNTWCSSGAAMPDGSLLQTGGYNDGDRNVRTYKPCKDDSCDWEEFNAALTERRWYATNQILPDGRQIIVGGRRQFNFEFYPKTPGSDLAYNLPFLWDTDDRGIENNLFPFVFLNVDGNLFIFANNRAILFDYVKKQVVRTYPTIPGGDPRNYPSSGSAVLLPLTNLQAAGGKGPAAEVLVCGGAPNGSFTSANSNNFVKALSTCARIRITDPNPQWSMETMPLPRVMGDMVLLPNGNVLIINGAASGTAGWNVARDPVLKPVIYRPGNRFGSRFEVQKSTSTPRMYHSTAILLRDGRVLVAGSNTHAYDTFAGVQFPTDLTLEAYSPDYLDPRLAKVRPRITSPASHSEIGYGQPLNVTFTAQGGINRSLIRVTMAAPPYTTHSFSMNQRMLVLTNEVRRSADVTPIGRSNYQVRVVSPGSSILAPPGYYLLFVVYREVPSPGIWIRIK